MLVRGCSAFAYCYLLRPNRLSRRIGLARADPAPYLARLWPHFWMGYLSLALSFLHATQANAAEGENKSGRDFGSDDRMVSSARRSRRRNRLERRPRQVFPKNSFLDHDRLRRRANEPPVAQRFLAFFCSRCWDRTDDGLERLPCRRPTVFSLRMPIASAGSALMTAPVGLAKFMIEMVPGGQWPVRSAPMRHAKLVHKIDETGAEVNS